MHLLSDETTEDIQSDSLVCHNEEWWSNRYWISQWMMTVMILALHWC